MTVFYLRQAEARRRRASLPGGFTGEARARRVHGGSVLGGAVERNRIKRRLREAVRQRRAVLQGAGAVDVVINPKKSVLTWNFLLVLEEVGRALDTIAKKLGMRNEVSRAGAAASL